MKKYLSLFTVLVITFILSAQAIKAQNEENQNNDNKVACTMEAKQCDDGSFVSRTGPSCEFEKCPDENDEDEETKGLFPTPKTKDELNTKKEEIKKELELEREKTKKEIELKREELKTKMEALRESIKNEKNAAKAKTKGERITSREKALEKFDKMVSGLTELKDKIKTRITYFDTKDIDTTAAKVFLTTIENKLNTIQLKISEAHSLFSTSTDELTKEEKITLQDLTKNIQNIVNEIRDDLNNAIKSLRDSMVNKK